MSSYEIGVLVGRVLLFVVVLALIARAITKRRD